MTIILDKGQCSFIIMCRHFYLKIEKFQENFLQKIKNIFRVQFFSKTLLCMK